MDKLATFYERMFFIRRFEETLLDLFSLGKLVGTTHTYIGQEANAVGLIDHLDPDVDTIFSNHRCHGHYLAFTDDAFGHTVKATKVVQGRTEMTRPLCKYPEVAKYKGSGSPNEAESFACVKP